MHKNTNRYFGNIRSAVAVTLIVVIAVLSAGCSFVKDLFKPDTLEFTQQNLSLYVGDVYDISDILKTNTSSYSLSSSDSSVVTVNGSKITARAVGAANITAKTSSKSAKLKVVVSEKVNDSVTIAAGGDTVQTYGKTGAVTFTVTATGEPAKSDAVYWYVNGELERQLSKSDSFVFWPTDVGVYIITAKCGAMTSDGITVRVYNAVEAQVEVSGSLEQIEPFADIVITVATSGGMDNYFQYLVDGKLLYEGDSNTYTYKPTAGRHTLSVKVNGQTEYTEEFCFRGSVVPTVGNVEYDNMYPHVYLGYEAVGKVKVEITSASGVTEYSQTDTRYAQLFDGAAFDMGELIDICASGDSRRMYKFRIKSLGDGDVITESEYSDYVTFTQLPAGAKKYIQTILPCGDLYVTSDEEYVRITEYYVYFRQKTANVTVSYDCYIGYNRTGSAIDLWNSAFPIAATSGTYSGITARDLGGGVMRTSFNIDTVNSPTRQSDDGGHATQLHAILPHINFDASKNRPENYMFAIDKISRTAEVTYSDELYLAVQNGMRPVPKAGSSAYTLYEQARKILRSICTDDMTDVQKAHAIYDWIMWQVTYDTPATEIPVGSGERYSAYYPEGVLGDGATSIGGVMYKPYAVCDGMSKTYSLMCNIEGIPCVRVVGRAGKSTLGGHAWNKVFVRGAWYVVDCTWGDSTAKVALDGAARDYELGLHSYLFLTDAQVYDTHYEPYRYANTTVRYSPQTAKTPINVYADMTINGVKINAYISKNENEQNRIREIASAFANAYTKRSSITVIGGTNGGVYDVKYQAIEICAEDGFSTNNTTIASTIIAAINSVHKNATVRVFTLDQTVLVLMKT
ncbi:MAG: hypothetical protein J1F69_00975 [Clostridiales bacterium]|nr:hypothetical protein [Clostridiales bacterium]